THTLALLKSPGSPPDSDSGPRDLSCYRIQRDRYECSWHYKDSGSEVSHYLRCCRKAGRCCYFEAGSATTLQFSDQDGVSVLREVTFWVESRGANRTEKSAEVNVTLNKWVKYDPPENTKVSRSAGQLSVTWEPPAHQNDAEVQFRHRLPGSPWKLVSVSPRSGVFTGPSQGGFISRMVTVEGRMMLALVRIRMSRVSVPGTQRWLRNFNSVGDGEGRGVPGAAGALCASPLTKATAMKSVHLGEAFNLSGAAYDLTVSWDGFGPNQTWHIPAETQTEAGVLNISVGANGTTIHWPAPAQGMTYCAVWQSQGQNESVASCIVNEPQEGDPDGLATHNLSQMFGAMGQEVCYHIMMFASAHPENVTSWSTVLSTYHFGGNASGAWSPQHVSVKNFSSSSVCVDWTPSLLSACPGVLKGYVVRYTDEDSSQVTEWPVAPTETHAVLQGLQAGVVYIVQVRADTAWLQSTWSQPQRFSIEASVPMLDIFLASLGSFLSIFLLGFLGFFVLNRAARLLCPPLPTPCASTAVKFPVSQWKQDWFGVSPTDFLEEVPPQEPLVVNMSWDENAEANLDTPKPQKEETELLQRAPEYTFDVELPLENRRQVSGHPEPGARALVGRKI
ncbi:Interleukin-12 receptor subunit beta-1, partial [Galemys pyrenaicus]